MKLPQELITIQALHCFPPQTVPSMANVPRHLYDNRCIKPGSMISQANFFNRFQTFNWFQRMRYLDHCSNYTTEHSTPHSCHFKNFLKVHLDKITVGDVKRNIFLSTERMTTPLQPNCYIHTTRDVFETVCITI